MTETERSHTMTGDGKHFYEKRIVSYDIESRKLYGALRLSYSKSAQ